MKLFNRDASNHKISKSGIFSYAFSLIYLLFSFFLEPQNKSYLDYGFIVLHAIITLMGIFIFSWIYFAVFISLRNPKLKRPDKEKVKLVMKTFPHRIFLSLIYWILPIGFYIYNIFGFIYLYLFKWIHLWFPILYLLGERYIIWKEKKIKSPISSSG